MFGHVNAPLHISSPTKASRLPAILKTVQYVRGTFTFAISNKLSEEHRRLPYFKRFGLQGTAVKNNTVGHVSYAT